MASTTLMHHARVCVCICVRCVCVAHELIQGEMRVCRRVRTQARKWLFPTYLVIGGKDD